MNGLFRFPAAVRRDPEIDVWFTKKAPELGALAATWFERMRECGPACSRTGKRMRHVKIRPGVDLEAAALAALIGTAYADMKLRLAAEHESEFDSSGRLRKERG